MEVAISSYGLAGAGDVGGHGRGRELSGSEADRQGVSERFHKHLRSVSGALSGPILDIGTGLAATLLPSSAPTRRLYDAHMTVT